MLRVSLNVAKPSKKPSNRPVKPENNWGGVGQIQEWLQAGIKIYFFVHCPTEDMSPINARYFQQLLEESGVVVPPLPGNNLQQSPHQLSLW